MTVAIVVYKGLIPVVDRILTLVREQDFLSNVAYGHKISLKDAKAFSRQALNTSIGKTFLGMFSEI